MKNKRSVIVTVLWIAVLLISGLLRIYSYMLPHESGLKLSFIGFCVFIFLSPIMIALIFKYRIKK